MTNSLAFPAMFDIARNSVAVIEDNVSIVNRSRLVLLSEPTELYNEPQFGAGLKRFLWQYMTENSKAMIRDRIVEQLRLYEPSCDADKTSFSDRLLFTGDAESSAVVDYSSLKLTVGLKTIYGDNVEVALNDKSN